MQKPSLPRSRAARIVVGAAALGLAAAVAGGATTGALAAGSPPMPDGHDWVGRAADGNPWHDGPDRDRRAAAGASTDDNGWGNLVGDTPWGP